AALALDLGLFHRESREVRFREALSWTGVWLAVALLFAFAAGPRFIPGWTPNHTARFLTGYLVELSLSMDNVFVIAVIFSYFRVPRAWQHRVLFWGILGALAMRGVMIWAGSELVERFHWTLYLMGAFLVFTGARMALGGGGEENPGLDHNPVVRLARRFLPVSPHFDGERFTTVQDGQWRVTPLFLVLLVVETTDVVFALDSIPAIFGITTDRFLIFTSNVFAILCLRSMYFVLASAMGYFRYLKFGLALILVLIGAKMLGEPWLKHWLGERLTNLSLACVVGIILVSMLASLLAAWRENRGAPR
ncbi:MAG: TerC/Alx family metal homeostasis membrane protein, partial [Verrucomicrobiota bacterium]